MGILSDTVLLSEMQKVDSLARHIPQTGPLPVSAPSLLLTLRTGACDGISAPSARSKVNLRLGGSHGTGSPPEAGPAESECFTHGRSFTKDGNAREGMPWVYHSSRER